MEGKPTYLAGFKTLSEVVFCHAFFAQLREEGLDLDGLAASVLQQTGQNPLQTDRVTATRELAKKVTDFMVSLQPQATVGNASSEVSLLKKQVELLQQQFTGFQQPSPGAPTTSPTETTAPADAAPPSQPAVPLSTVHESSNEPGASDHAAMVKGPDGSTKLQKQGPQDAKHPLFHAFEKAVRTSDGVPEVVVSSSSGSQTGKTNKDSDHADASMALAYGTAANSTSC